MPTQQKIISRLALLISFIFIFNFIAGKFFLYQSVWWIDMPMHFIGGVTILLLVAYVFYSRISYPLSLRQVIYLIGGMLIIGVGWEVFEYLIEIFISHFPFSLPDTLSDIFFDLAGATAGVLYLTKQKSSNPSLAEV